MTAILGDILVFEFDGLELRDGTFIKVDINGDVFKNGCSVTFYKDRIAWGGINNTAIPDGGYIPVVGNRSDANILTIGFGASAIYSSGEVKVKITLTTKNKSIQYAGNFGENELAVNFRRGIYYSYGEGTDIYSIFSGSSSDYSASIIDVSAYRNAVLMGFFTTPSTGYPQTFFVDDNLRRIGGNLTNDGKIKAFAVPSNARYFVISNCSTDVPNPRFMVRSFENKNKYIHFSLDDVSGIIQNLVTNSATYSSIFDEPKLALLKQWHDAYGIKISLYVQRTLSDIPAKFKNDFILNKGWIKFGYHGQGNNLATANYEQAKAIWNSFVDGLMQSIGDYDLIDRCPRLDYFHCTLDGAKGLRDAKCGVVGLLSCDDWAYNKATRATNYYLTDAQSTWLDAHDKFVDNENQLTIVKTDFRLEQIVQRWTTIENCLADYSSANRANEAYWLEVFSHENIFTTYTTNMLKILGWAAQHGYRNDYPMNVII